MNEVIQLVSQFHSHAHAGESIADKASLYTELLREEFAELVEAIDDPTTSRNLVTKNAQILEEAADVVIVLFGVLASQGIELGSLQEAMRRKAISNLSKLSEPEFDSNGKLLKGKNYVKAAFDDLVAIPCLAGNVSKLDSSN